MHASFSALSITQVHPSGVSFSLKFACSVSWVFLSDRRSTDLTAFYLNSENGMAIFILHVEIFIYWAVCVTGNCRVLVPFQFFLAVPMKRGGRSVIATGDTA